LPSSNTPSRKLIGLLASVVLLIVYGSLYPWEFEPLRDTDPLTILLHSWDFELNRFILRDIAVNVALYLPLGFAAYLVFRRPRRRLAPILLAAVMGCALSCMVEMAQAFEPDRHTSLVDVATNVSGAIAGAVAAMLAERAFGPFGLRVRSGKPRDASALALLGSFVASLLFPLFPVFGRTALRIKIAAILHGPVFDPVLFFSALASWYAAGLMMRAAGVGKPVTSIGLALAPLALQVFIVHHEPWIAVVVGAIAGAVLACTLRPAAPAAGLVMLMIVVRGLQPFHFARSAQPFLWIPFGGFLAMDWATGVDIIFQKIFYYGSAVWLLCAAGVRLRTATFAVTFLLACLEGVQILIPAHTAEITDPLLALLLGFGIAALSPFRGKEIRSRSQG
jgi:glycopeptide antibiotics resistance protein